MHFFRYMLLTLFLVYTSFALTPAGLIISNTAKIEYEDKDGFKYKEYSNTVSIKVLQVYGLDIYPDYQTVTALPNSNIYLSYRLKNTGNGKDKYVLTVKNEVTDDADIEDLKIFIDKNENGKLDPGEQQYNNTNPPVVEAEGYIPLLVVGKTQNKSGISKIRLEGTSLGNDSIYDSENIAQIKVERNKAFDISKDTNKSQVLPGENINFTILAENNGAETEEGVNLETDFDNDGSPEILKGVVIEDEIPKYTSFKSASKAPVNSKVIYKGDNDSYWKDDLTEIKGNLKYVGLYISSLDPDQQVRLDLSFEVNKEAPATDINNLAVLKTSLGDINSNIVTVKIKENLSISIDDTDDNDSFTGSNRYTDNDDNMIIYSMSSGKGFYVDFVNEAWNLGNKDQVINIFWDKGSSKNIDPNIMHVVFLDINGNPLTDTNNDGYIDVGLLKPGERVKFITRVYVDERSFKDVVIAVKGFTENTTDFTFDIIKDIQPATAKVKVLTIVQTGFGFEPLRKHRVAVYEFDNDGNLLSEEPIVLWTDENGYILYDEEGDIKTLYDVLEDNKKYRITVYGKYKDREYTLSPFIEKRYFDAVENTGEEKCWNRSGIEVPCDDKRKDIVKIKVLSTGTKELQFPLDPAGYVYDPLTNEKIENACVYFYRCSDETCENYILVDNDLLDIHTNPEAGHQTNPQLTSKDYTLDGEPIFEFVFRNFVPTLRGWYFLKVDFNCAGADTTLKDKYQPVTLQADKVWNPNDNDSYHGEKIYIDETFPQTIPVIIPLGRPATGKLIIEKSVYPSVASIGDFVKWKITVKNKGSSTVFDTKIIDHLPRGFRYKNKTTKIDGISETDPEISSNGRDLTWTLGNLNPGETKTIEFYTSVITSAPEGKLKNTAFAEGWSDNIHTAKINSNEGFAYIKITKGIFTDKGYIFGKVFIDQNKNGIHDENEPVIQGAKIYLDNGRYAVTDIEGKYHFDNLNPRTYVVKIDKTSLPKGAKLLITGNRNAGDPSSVFADVYPGEMHKVNFALAPFNPEMEIFQTMKKISGKISVKRGIEDILVDPVDNKIKIKNFVLIENKTKNPIYEVSYIETSSAVPLKGTSYINGSPFKDPKIKGNSFRWDIPLILPKEKTKISWLSFYKGGKLEPKATINLKLNPSDKSVALPVKIPIEFEPLNKGIYKVTVYFDFGSANLSKEAKQSLMKVVEFLQKHKCEHIYINIKAHTDAVRVVNPKIKTNTNLSLLRAEAVKNFLKKHLVDLKRVEIR